MNDGSINKLFKMESKIMILIFMAPLLVGLLLALLLPKFMDEVEIEIDKCLDSGGSFNYDECQCDFNKNHLKPEKNSCE